MSAPHRASFFRPFGSPQRLHMVWRSVERACGTPAQDPRASLFEALGGPEPASVVP